MFWTDILDWGPFGFDPGDPDTQETCMIHIELRPGRHLTVVREPERIGFATLENGNHTQYSIRCMIYAPNLKESTFMLMDTPGNPLVHPAFGGSEDLPFELDLDRCTTLALE